MKKTKLKKIRKGHIWPSVVFLIFSILLALIATFVLSGFAISYFVEDRLESAYYNTETITRMFSDKLVGKNERQLMQFLEKESELSDAVYILDKQKKSLSGYGGETYVLETGMPADFNSLTGFTIYADKASTLYSPEDGNLHFINIFKNELPMKSNFQFQSTSDLFSRNVIFEDYIWLSNTLSDDKTIMVKCRISLYQKDFVFATIIAMLFAIFMLFPLLFLLINLIRNILQQRRMTTLLYTNSVTGGHSWLHFLHHATHELRARSNKKTLYAIVDISMIKYRNYCNYHGVKAGETLLRKIDWQISSHLNKSECCTYYGKSSYALLLKCNTRENGEDRVRTILQNLPRATGHDNIIFHAGIYFVEPQTSAKDNKIVPRRNIDIAEYYNHASSARASVTDENKIDLAVFNDHLLEEQLWEHKVEEKMQQALDQEKFMVYIQPKYNPVTNKLAGAEALVRWIDDEDGFISPGRFIPIFEKNGFITKLDDYMISHVAKLQSEWLKEGKDLVPVSVNVSRAHFANPNLAQHICSLVDTYQLPHQWLEIELTESAFFDDKSALLNTVKELKELGFDISMDDFGAGYSSLNSLKDLPLDVLKLDAEFFRGEDGEERGEIVVSEAIQLAKKLNMRIVAEGVEKKNQVDFLASQECDMIQGYYYAKPMPAAEYHEKLEEEQTQE